MRKSKDKRIFRRTAIKTHKSNLPVGPSPRGGTRR